MTLLNGLSKIDPNLISKYKPEEKTAFTKNPFIKFNVNLPYLSNYTYKVKRSDIDANKHMHNLNHLKLAYEALPNDVYENSSDFSNLEIMYKKEIKLGDIVNCYYSFYNNIHYVTIKSENNAFLHAIISLKNK